MDLSEGVVWAPASSLSLGRRGDCMDCLCFSLEWLLETVKMNSASVIQTHVPSQDLSGWEA